MEGGGRERQRERESKLKKGFAYYANDSVLLDLRIKVVGIYTFCL